MAISFHKQRELARDDDFRILVEQAALTVATEVLVEVAVAGDETTARQSLAQRALRTSSTTADQLAFILATKSPYEAGDSRIDDVLVLDIIQTEWTMLAGYNPNITPAP